VDDCAEDQKTIERFSKPKSNSPNLGTYWFEDRDKGIQWVKDAIGSPSVLLKLTS
jgi:hypothetical protein